MSQHPYLRAYMAGIAVPTMFLLVAATAFSFARFVLDVPIPVERVLVFPMAVVPNLWGVWNILYLALPRGWRLPLGLHGAILPFVLVPLGWTLARALDITFINLKLVAMVFPVGLAVYYLAWKYFVRFFSELIGLA